MTAAPIARSPYEATYQPGDPPSDSSMEVWPSATHGPAKHEAKPARADEVVPVRPVPVTRRKQQRGPRVCRNRPGCPEERQNDEEPDERDGRVQAVGDPAGHPGEEPVLGPAAHACAVEAAGEGGLAHHLRRSL